MKERPIIFSAPMLRAILEGRKTQTRRIVKVARDDGIIRGGRWWPLDDPAAIIACPYGVAGSRLWVRETWQYEPQTHCICPQGSEPQPCDDWIEGIGCRSNRTGVVYRADKVAKSRWRSPIHMPRWASRITLEVTGVRVERLQDISSDDAIEEGIDPSDTGNAVEEASINCSRYCDLWESINGAGAWDKNPWVWVVEFKRS